MNKEFKKLYDKWYSDTFLLASRDIKHEPGFIELVKWSKDNKEEAVDSIVEMLKEAPDFIVYVLDELFGRPLTAEGHVSLEQYCNVWLNLIEYEKSGKKDLTKVDLGKDNYKEYREYMIYMDDNFIPFNPFKESDPNVTLEEFRQGKRNK